ELFVAPERDAVNGRAVVLDMEPGGLGDNAFDVGIHGPGDTAAPNGVGAIEVGGLTERTREEVLATPLIAVLANRRYANPPAYVAPEQERDPFNEGAVLELSLHGYRDGEMGAERHERRVVEIREPFG